MPRALWWVLVGQGLYEPSGGSRASPKPRVESPEPRGRESPEPRARGSRTGESISRFTEFSLVKRLSCVKREERAGERISRFTDCSPVKREEREGERNAARAGESSADCHSSQFKNNYFTEMCSGSEAGSYLRLIDFCITQL